MTADLFRPIHANDRLERFTLLFESWVAERRRSPESPGRRPGALRERSAQVYADMWNAFANWCSERQSDLANIDEASLHAFLDSLGRHKEATPAYVRRTIQLIGRLDAFESARASRPANAAILAVRKHPRVLFAGDGDTGPAPDFLTASQSRALIGFLTRSASMAAGSWQDLRNRAALAVQLGAGLTPGEVLDLRLSRIVVLGGRVAGEPWALSLPSNGNFPARQTPLAGWSGRLLGSWLTVRLENRIPGDFVFPATRTGRVWSKMGSNKAYAATLLAAGVAQPSGGSFFLRHSFALRQLTRHAPEQVAAWLGLQDPAAMERYRRVLYSPVEVV